MPTIKQETVNGKTYELKKYKTEHPEHTYEYYVTEDGGPVEDPVYTRADGDRQFRETIRLVKRADDSKAGGMGPSLPGFDTKGGADTPFLPGFSDADDKAGDDDDGFRFPFM